MSHLRFPDVFMNRIQQTGYCEGNTNLALNYNNLFHHHFPHIYIKYIHVHVYAFLFFSSHSTWVFLMHALLKLIKIFKIFFAFDLIILTSILV